MVFKDIKNLKKDISEIKETLNSNLSEKSKELDELKKYLSYIKLRVKTITPTIDSYGNDALKVVYEAPQIVLNFDEDGNIESNEVFRAINALELIDIKDQLNLALEIEKKQKN